MVSPKDEARSLAWICIWISTILDWIALLAFALKVKDNPNIQTEVIVQADQNEIAQGDVVVTETTVVTQVQQPAPQAQQPTPEVQQPTPEVQQPAPEVQQPDTNNPA